MENNLDFILKPVVIVTGFGPFTHCPVNASWEGVKLINKYKIEKQHNCELVIIEIPVIYENIDELVPVLWKTYNPKLMIHVGVSDIATCCTLEMQAHRRGYTFPDYLQKYPVNYTCPADGGMKLHTKLNVERLCKEFNGQIFPDCDINAIPSIDAGRYLCEYIYYTSLCVDNTRTLFVHVPDTNLYSSETTARGLERILDLCLQQLDELDAAADITINMNDACLCDDKNLSSY